MKRRPPKAKAKAPTKKNPEGGGFKSLLPWLVGLGGAAVVGYGAYRMLGSSSPAPDMQGMSDPAVSLAAQQQYAAMQAQGIAPGGLMGITADEGRLPVVALPGESARRTAQARRFLPQQAAAAGLPMTQQQAAAAQMGFQQQQGGMVPQGIPIESFGGGENGGSLGNETF